jgi:hypothetical protein
LPYLRGHFSAGLTAPSAASVSINAFIQRLLSAQTCLANFIEQVSISYRTPSKYQFLCLMYITIV